jgi:hypothetical protein
MDLRLIRCRDERRVFFSLLLDIGEVVMSARCKLRIADQLAYERVGFWHSPPPQNFGAFPEPPAKIYEQRHIVDRHLLHEVTVVERLPEATIADLANQRSARAERWLTPNVD